MRAFAEVPVDPPHAASGIARPHTVAPNAAPHIRSLCEVGASRLAPIGRSVWADTKLELPGRMEQKYGRFRDVFTGRSVCACEGALEAAAIFEKFPVALLVAEGGED